MRKYFFNFESLFSICHSDFFKLVRDDLVETGGKVGELLGWSSIEELFPGFSRLDLATAPLLSFLLLLLHPLPGLLLGDELWTFELLSNSSTADDRLHHFSEKEQIEVHVCDELLELLNVLLIFLEQALVNLFLLLELLGYLKDP